MDSFLNSIKQTLNPNNQIRAEAEENLNSLKEQNIRELISVLIQIISTDYFKENLQTFLATMIYAWRLFPETVNDIPEDPEKHPFAVYSDELVQQLIDASFNLMVDKGPNNTTVPLQVRRIASILYARIVSIQVHKNFEVKVITKLSEFLAQSHTLNDVIPLSQAIQIICEEFEPDEDEVSSLFTTLFNIFESEQDPQILSELLDVLAKTVTGLTSALNNEEILKNTITTLLNLSTVDGVQASAFKVWSCIYKNSPSSGDGDNVNIIAIVADQLIEISLSILADENKSEDDIKAACTLVKQIAKLEYLYDNDEFIPIRSNAQPLIISLVRVCCTSDDDSCNDKSAWLPYMAASEAIKKVFILLSDEDLESVLPIMKNLASSEQFNERFGGLIILARIIKYADNDYIGFQFLPSLFEVLENDKAPSVIFQAIKCIKDVILRYAEALLHEDSEKPSQEIVDQLPQVCENCYNMMMQILVISDEQTQEEEPQQAELEATTEQLTLNLSSFSRHNNSEEDEYLYSPIALQAAGLLAEITRTQGFSNTVDVLNALLENGLKYKVSKFFIYETKVIDYGKDVGSVVKFFDTILEALHSAIQEESNYWAIQELGEIIQAYLSKHQAQIQQRSPDLLNLLIQTIHVPSIYATDAFIPIGMVCKNYPSVFVDTTVSEDGQESVPARQIILNALVQALGEVESSDIVYRSSFCLWCIIMAISKSSKDEVKSAETIGSEIAQMTPTLLGLLMEAIANFNLSLSARRSCIDCIASLANFQPELVLPIVNDFAVFLRTFSLSQALHVSIITDPEETQLMLAALARSTVSIMNAVGPQEALKYKDIAKDIVVFVGDLTESDGTMERCCAATIDLILHLSKLDKNYILEIIQNEPSVGDLIVTARSSQIEHAQEVLDILGYTE